MKAKELEAQSRWPRRQDRNHQGLHIHLAQTKVVLLMVLLFHDSSIIRLHPCSRPSRINRALLLLDCWVAHSFTPRRATSSLSTSFGSLFLSLSLCRSPGQPDTHTHPNQLVKRGREKSREAGLDRVCNRVEKGEVMVEEEAEDDKAPALGWHHQSFALHPPVWRDVHECVNQPKLRLPSQ